ncbi:S8 family serine peptidase [Paenibacillus donghaensis]|uniref:S8 family peptidase n=1 Tax=Paenibacillus donghaensis TaxID=414771 RepID=UPI001883B356|nr:S8 family serine peptidase [Paenibacillus donghaensis]MBE9915653.1 S8 family serine peptidase [Paenibacillus donghaensis]
MSMLIVLKNRKSLLSIWDFLKGKREVRFINYLMEINTLKVECYSSQQQKSLMLCLNSHYNDYIEDISFDLALTPNGFSEFASDSKSLGAYKSMYYPLAWNIRLVTSNYETFKYSTGKNITIGIIDSGIDFQHPDLAHNISSLGGSFISNDDNHYDSLGHGTMIAGIIAANGDLVGIGPDIKLASYKVFDEGNAYSSAVIKAIIQAVNDHVDIINISLSTWKSVNENAIIKAYRRAFKYAEDNNVLVVASSGNEGVDLTPPTNSKEQHGIMIHMPSGFQNVITVGATTISNCYAPYSNYGSNITISAPGGDLVVTDNMVDLKRFIVTTFPTTIPQSKLSREMGLKKGFTPMIGTSLASSHVAAALGVLKSYYLNQYGREPRISTLKKALVKGSIPLQSSQPNCYGVGIVNLSNSLRLLQKM